MFNKNAKDPVADSVRKVMEQNEKERAAARAVNEKFGIVDRRALPHERQPEWDAAYKKVLSEGVETLDELSREKLERYVSKAGKQAGQAAVKGALGDKEAQKTFKKRLKGISLISKKEKRGDIKEESLKSKRLQLILKRRLGKGDGKESVEQSRREDK